MQIKTTREVLVPDKEYVCTNLIFSHWTQLYNLDKIHGYLRTLKSKYQAAQGRTREVEVPSNWWRVLHFIPSMSQPEHNTGETWKWALWCRQTEVQEKPSRPGSRSRKENSWGSERVEEIPWIFYTLFSTFSHAPVPRQFCSKGSNSRELASNRKLQESKLWAKGTFLSIWWSYISKRAEPNTFAFILSLSPVIWPQRQHNHRDGWFLAERTKGELQEARKYLEIVKRNVARECKPIRLNMT